MRHVLKITSALYLLLHLAAPLWRGHTWGFDALGESASEMALFILAALLLVLLWENPSVLHRLLSLFSNDFPSVYLRWISVLLLGAIFALLTTQTHLLGDGRLLLRELALGAESPQDRAPLFFFVIRWIHALMADAETSYRVLSIASGLAFSLLAFLISAELTQDACLRWVIGMLIVTQGYVLLFFGYVETYATLFAVSALYVYVALRCLKGTAPLYLAAVVLALPMCLHLAAISLVPSLVVLTVNRSEVSLRYRLGTIMLTPILVGVVMILLDYPFFANGDSLLSKHLLPLYLPLQDNAAYTVFALDHLSDVGNALVLASPAFAVGFPLMAAQSHPEHRVLGKWFLSLALPPLVMIAVMNPEIGAFRDWDILAFPSLFLTIAVAHRVGARKDTALSTSVLLLGVSLLHVVPWVLVNHDTERAIARFEVLLRTAANSRRGVTYGWDTLGGYFRDEGRFDEAYQTYLNAINTNHEHPRLLRVTAHAAGEAGRHEEAVEHFESALVFMPDVDTLIVNYGRALLKVGRIADAAAQFNRVATRSADQPDVMRLLALARFRQNAYDEALTIVDSVAAKFPPGIPSDYVMAGTIHSLLDRPGEAIVSFRKALDLAPGDVTVLRRLAAAYRAVGDPVSTLSTLHLIHQKDRGLEVYRAIGFAHYVLGAFDSSAAALDRALALDPGDADLHFRLGSARLSAGRISDAIPALREAIAQDPTITGAFRNLAKAYSVIGQDENAKEVLTDLLTRYPDIPDRIFFEKWISEH